MIDLQLFSEYDLSIELKVGQKFVLKTHVHASVGYDTDYEIYNEDILDLEDESMQFDHPPKEGEHVPPGGDAGFELLEFEAKAPGTTILHFKKVYRGQTKDSKKIQIIVS